MIALGDRSAFPALRGVYLNHAAISPLSQPVADAMKACVDDYAAKGLGALGRWMDQREALRRDLGDLLGVPSARLALTPSTSHGLLHLAWGMPWKEGDVIVGFEGEFPANVIPWRQVAQHFGLELRLIPQRLEALEAELRGGGVRLVASSAVQFSTGFRMPIEQMGPLCHRYGAELAVDGIQAIGAVPLDLQDVDYLAGGSHKWLMGPEGCAFVYVAEGKRLVPRLAGWLSVPSPVDFLLEGQGLLRYDKPIRDEPSALEMGSCAAVAFAGLGAAVKVLLALGVDRIHNHVQGILDSLEAGMLARGFDSARSSSCTLSLGHPDAMAIAAHLNERGVAVTAPNGRLRMAPHWPNALDQVEEVLRAVDER